MKRKQIPIVYLASLIIPSTIFVALTIFIFYLIYDVAGEKIVEHNQWLRYKQAVFLSVKGEDGEVVRRKCEYGKIPDEHRKAIDNAINVGNFIREEYKKEGTTIEKIMFESRALRDFLYHQMRNSDGGEREAAINSSLLNKTSISFLAMARDPGWISMAGNKDYIGILNSYLQDKDKEVLEPEFKDAVSFIGYLRQKLVLVLSVINIVFFGGYIVLKKVDKGSFQNGSDCEWHDLEYGRPITYLILILTLPESFLFAVATAVFNVIDRVKRRRTETEKPMVAPGKGHNRKINLDSEDLRRSLDESKATLARLSERSKAR